MRKLEALTVVIFVMGVLCFVFSLLLLGPGVLFLLAASSLHFIVSDYQSGLLWRTENLIGYPIVAMFIGGMWFYFTRQKTKDLFRRTIQSNEHPVYIPK